LVPSFIHSLTDFFPFNFSDLFSRGGGFRLGDEAGDAGVYDRIEALARLDTVDFVEGILGKWGDIEIFLARAADLGVVRTAVPR
jgi:hypothetical protein